MSLYSMLESVATIKRPTVGQDSQGGTTSNPFQIVSNDELTICKDLPCSVQEIRPEVMALYSQQNSSIYTTIYFETDPNSQANDIIYVVDMANVQSTYLCEGRAKQIGRLINAPWYVRATKIDEPHSV